MLLKQTVVKLAKALNCTVEALMDVFCEMITSLEHKNHIVHSTRHLDFVQKGRKLTDTKKIVNVSLYNVYSVYQSVILMRIPFFYTFLIRWFYQL